MKKYILFIVFTIYTMIYPSLTQGAAFDSSGQWTYNVVNDKKHLHLCQVQPGKTIEVNLTGDIVIKDRVFVGTASALGPTANPEPATLIIRNHTGRAIYIWNEVISTDIYDADAVVDGVKGYTQKAILNTLFSVFINGKLVIEGDENSPIIINGNGSRADITDTPYGFIESQGTLDFKYVTVENVKFQNHPGGTSVFKLSSYAKKNSSGQYEGYKLGTTSLDHCTIRNIQSPYSYGAVMLSCFKMDAITTNTRASNKVSITNCEIHSVTQGAAATLKNGDGEEVDAVLGTGGLIRFRGGWVGDFYMKNTSMHHNTTVGIGGCVFWNAIGRASDRPVFTIDGCEFAHNTTNTTTVEGTEVKGSAPAMVLQGNFKFDGDPTIIWDNKAPYIAGGIYVMGYTGKDKIGKVNITMDINDKLNVYDNSAELGGGVMIYCPKECTMDAGSTVTVNINGCNIHDNTATRMGGGMHIQWKSDQAKARPLTVNLNQGTFTNNKVTDTTAGNTGGGGLSIMGGTVKSSSGARCTFSGNTSGYQGGAIRFDDGANVQLGTVDITNCSAAYGGGITVEGSGTTMTMSDVEISNCSATKSGGGMSLYESASATINSANITGCTANGGGAVSAYGGSTLTINQATIDGNTATYDESDTSDVDTDTHYNGCGGALLANASTIKINDGTISNCTARDGAGVYLNLGSTFGMTKGVISDNIATRRGGGVYSSGVGFALQDGLITRNSAGDFGGGIFFNNGSNSNSGNISIAGGTVSYNKSYGGGGIYCYTYNKSNLEISNTVMEYNEALLGGGLLSYCSYLTLSNAYIRYNKALKGSFDLKTLCNFVSCNMKTPGTDGPNERTLGGVGGGLFSDYKSYVKFNTSAGFGIYGNTADYGADDIFTSRNTVYFNDQIGGIELPAIAELGLSGYNAPVSKSQLFWAEDYLDNDPNYEQGTNGLKGTGEKNVRYRTSLENMSTSLSKTKVNAGTYKNQYLMLAVGFAMAKVTLKKNGLQKGETCVFKIYAQDGDQYHASTGAGNKPVSPLNCYMTVMMVGGGTSVDTKTLILPAGYWIAQESPYWAWTYDKVDDTNPPVNTIEDPLLIGAEVTTNSNTVFEFTNTKRTNITTPHAEGVKQNSLQKQ